MLPRRSTIRGIITRAIVFLLLGAIVNVAVAWGFAIWCGSIDPAKELVAFGNSFGEGATLWSRMGSERWFFCLGEPIQPAGAMTTILPDGSSIENDAAKEEHQLLQQFAEGMSLWGVARHFGTARTLDQAARIDSQLQVKRPSGYSFHAIDFRGWPARSLSCDFSPHPKTALTTSDFRNGLLLPPHQRVMMGTIPFPWLEIRVLPLVPVWPGFAINTIFYAAILWLLFAFPFTLRRRRRIKRGLCPACAYPIGTSPVCTECGKPVTPRRGDGV